MMTISDEQLSAFLDQELSEKDMALIREALSVDSVLADRLAELAVADEQVRAHASAIDSVPMPDSITRLLRAHKVVDISWWRRTSPKFAEHAALAASVVLLLGLGLAVLLPKGSPGSAPDWQHLATYLETTPSGTSLAVTADTQLTAGFSFLDRQGAYCRQFQVDTAGAVSENIACRREGGWELIATAQDSRVQDQGAYSLASGAALLDSMLDTLMSGQALSLQEEAELIEQGWSD